MNAPELARASITAGTVLLVEDDEAARLATAEMLRSCGWRVLEAACAEHALQPLRQHGVSLLMVDVRLPGESGLVFAARARQTHPTLLVVLVTSDELPGDEPGGSGPVLLRKPYGFEALKVALREAATR